MPYRSLYRRRRPSTFAGMVGQEHVSRTLSHALTRGQLAHAYLFCGPRGTGKTTAAKILARALNCERYPAPEPCGRCTSCLEISAGASLDVLEMDAASNRGIDEIRELRERTRYASGGGRYKVYIIDEVHMLTTEAFNAFLKTLEEPPAGVIFILATTDPGKLPATVISRCQRFNFNLLSAEEIRLHLAMVADQEGWKAEDEALRLVARLAEGSMRDALGLLEQAQAYGGEEISAENVRIVTGATRVETISALLEAVAAGDLSGGLAVLREVLYSGRDLQLFLRDLAYLFSRLYLGPAAGAGEFEPGFRDLLQRFSGCFKKSALLEAAELLYQAGQELRFSPLPQVVLEMALLRLLRVLREAPPADGEAAPASEHPLPANRPETKAGQPEKTGAALPLKPSARPPVVPRDSFSPGIKTPAPSADPARPDSTRAAAAAPGGNDAVLLKELRQAWPKLSGEVRRRKRSAGDYLAAAIPAEVRGNLVILHFTADDFTGAARLMEESNRLLAEEVLSSFCRRPVSLKAVQPPAGSGSLPVPESAAAQSAAAPAQGPGAAEEPAAATRAAGAEEGRIQACKPDKMKEAVEKPKGLIGEAMRLFDGRMIDAGDKEE